MPIHPIHMRDLVFHVSNQKTVELSAEALIKGVLENVATIGNHLSIARTKADLRDAMDDVAHVIVDTGNNLAALAGALTWGTKDQRPGQVNPAHISVNPPKNVRWPDRPVRAPAPPTRIAQETVVEIPALSMEDVEAMLAGADVAQHRVDVAVAAQEPNGPIDGHSDA
jgi:hypothetical protein